MALEESCEWKTSRQPESEEESVDCPDCYDAMIFYDWDSIRYVCENCDLTFSGTGHKKNKYMLNTMEGSSRTTRIIILKNEVCLLNFQLDHRLLPWQPSFSKFSALTYVDSLVYTYLYFPVSSLLKIHTLFVSILASGFFHNCWLNDCSCF